MLNSVRSYVNRNAGGNEDLIEAFTVCWLTSRKLINVLTNTYNYFLAAFERPEDISISKTNAIALDFLELAFKSRDRDLRNMEYKQLIAGFIIRCMALLTYLKKEM